MKNIIILLVFVFSIMSCNNGNNNAVDNGKLKNEISDLIDNWHKDAAEFRHDEYISAMSKDGVYIGTDAGEYWTTPEFSVWSKPYFEKKHTWNFRKLQRNVYIDPSQKFAWFDELLETAMGVCRGSGVVMHEENGWKIKQYVLSATIPNDLMRQVINLKHGADSLIISKYKISK